MKPKDNYYWNTYKWCNGSYDSQTKYCTNSSFGVVDYNAVLDEEDDAAAVNWGGAWRMPTEDEMTELLNNCTWTWTTLNGVNGCQVTGPSGKSIFLPAAGFREYDGLNYAGSFAIYCSSSLGTDRPSGAHVLAFYSDNMSMGGNYRFCGYSVRPVCP